MGKRPGRGNTMKIGDRVLTDYSEGIITGIDLPESRAWRWLVKIDKPIKTHTLIDQNKPLAFDTKEIQELVYK